MSIEELYYLQVKGYVGNSLLWWKKGRHGYTPEIRDAETFTKEAADGQARVRPGVDIPWKKSYIDAHISHHVNVELVDYKDLGAK